MATLDSLIKPQEATEFAQDLYQKLSDDYALSKYLPNLQQNSNKLQWGVDNRTPVASGLFRGWNTESYIIGRQGVGRRGNELAPMTIKMFMDEEQELALRSYEREDFGPIIDQLFDDIGTLTEAHVNTYEYLRGQLLSDARVTVKFKHAGSTSTYDEVIDYGLRSEHRVTAAVLWSDLANADPIGDLIAYCRVYQANNRRKPGAILISSRVEGYLLRNATIRQLVASTAGTPTQVGRDVLDRELNLKGLPPLIVVDETVIDETGTQKPALADHKITILPQDGPVGRTIQGVTPAFLGMAEEKLLTRETAPGIISQVWKNHDPHERYSLVESIGLPAPTAVNDLFIATVAAAS